MPAYLASGRHFLPGPINWPLVLRRSSSLAFGLALALYAAWPWLPWTRGAPTRTLALYSFSIMGEVINEGVFPAFQAQWEAIAGERVELLSSFAGSGTITNQIVLGVPAEVAILSLELDALRLVEAGIVDRSSWRDLPNGGVLNRTPFIILVHRGNPKGIRDFVDLTRPGVRIVHPDPLTSGGAQWAILAEYGSSLLATRDETAAFERLLGIWRNVVAQASSARGARTQFEDGFGDALITYEQEAVYDRARGRLDAEIVYPSRTILSDHTVVVIDRNLEPDQRELVNAFTRFLWSDTAQRIFVEYGFRSVNEALNARSAAFGRNVELFGVDDLGGWVSAKREIIDEVWKGRVLSELDR